MLGGGFTIVLCALEAKEQCVWIRPPWPWSS
jgi:hypothetical protein